MAWTVKVLLADGSGQEHMLAADETLAVGLGARVVVPDLAAAAVSGAITDSDGISLTFDGETVHLAGLGGQFELETGAALAFGDGTIIDSLAGLLDWAAPAASGADDGAAAGTAGLAAPAADAGDMVYLDDSYPDGPIDAGVSPPPLAIGDVVGASGAADAIAGLDADSDLADAGAANAGLWVDTEAALMAITGGGADPENLAVDPMAHSSDFG